MPIIIRFLLAGTLSLLSLAPAFSKEACLEKGNAKFMPKGKPRAPGPGEIQFDIASRDPSWEQIRQLGFDEPRGVYVVGTTPGYPAYEAGVRSGDIIVKYNGYLVKDGGTLQDVIYSLKIGDQFIVDLYRPSSPSNKCQKLTITLDDNPFR